MKLEKTYVQERGPQPLLFGDYAIKSRSKLSRILNINPEERVVQKFLEKNPCFVPGAWTPGSPSGHYPLHCALISQPKLPGLRCKVPDFMWIATNSDTWYPTLVEIEAPGKKIFIKNGVPSSLFTQARNQLAEWRTWFNSPTNIQLFMDSYLIPDSLRYYKSVKLHMILVYGRRVEFNGNKTLTKHRSSLLCGIDEELMSYDRLHPDKCLKDAVTVTMQGNGLYKVANINPTFTLGPKLANRLLHFENIEDAIRSCRDIRSARKEYLIRRVEYWRKWAVLPEKGIVGGTFDE